VAAPSSKDFIKRVIGVGGDHVVCCDAQGRITVNGHLLDEPYLFPGAKPSEQSFDVTVPAGRLWVMGDHRNESADSRAHQDDHLGTIATSNVIGRAFVKVWPPHHWGLLRVPKTFGQLGLVHSAVHRIAVVVVAVTPVSMLRRRRRLPRGIRRGETSPGHGWPPQRSRRSGSAGGSRLPVRWPER
jgi:signal peptidase I